jgi:hypothetical protein
MNTYEEYLVHRYQGGCNDLDCRWCFPPEIPPGACPPWDLLKEIELRDYRGRNADRAV